MTFAAADPFGQALTGLTGGLHGVVHAAAVILLALLAFEAGRVLTEGWRRIKPSYPGLQAIALSALRNPAEAAGVARAAPGPLAERTVIDLAAAAAAAAAAAPAGSAAASAAGTGGTGDAVGGAAVGGGPDAIEHALADYELRIQRRLDRTRMLVRAGPALGLMGTLIPLAPGLAALGDGDFEQLAGELQIAFAATVVGIVIGTGAFALTLYRTRVYTEDLAALERAVAAFGAGAATGPASSGGTASQPRAAESAAPNGRRAAVSGVGAVGEAPA